VTLYIQNIPPVFCEHLSIWFKSPARNGDLNQLVSFIL